MDSKDGTQSESQIRSSELVRRSPGRPTGYMIWDDGKLMQQFEYELSKWYGYWHTTRETEWLEVPTKKAPNAVREPSRTHDTQQPET